MATTRPPVLNPDGAGRRLAVAQIARPRPRWALVAIALFIVIFLAVPLLVDTQKGVDPATEVPTPPPPSTEVPTPPPSSGQFLPTGDLNQSCAWCPAALLIDGQVLVLSGSGAAEVYDPATGTFSQTGAPLGDFNQGSAVTLDDGRVLVMFGLSDRGEIYDPDIGLFEPTDITYPQGQNGIAVRLSDGNVLVLGYDRGPSGIFDPRNDSFTTVASPGLDGEFSAVLLEDGDVLIVDGRQAMTYNPVDGTIAETGDLNTPRGGHTLTRLLDGRVLIAGGQELDEPYDLVPQAEIYDPETTTFTVAGYMSVPRWWHAATLLSDGQVMLVGGRGDSPAGLDSAEIFDPTTGEFQPVTSTMSQPRVAGTAITLNDGRVLVFGHYPGNVPTGGEPPSYTAEVLRP